MSGPRLTLSQETSNRVSEVVLPPRMGRNEACHCDSGSKYKRCCWERDEALRRQLRGAAVPAGSRIPAANSINLKSTSPMSSACRIY